MEQKRVEWIDIYRGILIALMVVGHSTGLFNGYIYQFHMAAFFFLSGCLAHPEKKGILQVIFEKFCTILLPAISSAVLGIIVVWLINVINQNALSNVGVHIKDFFVKGYTPDVLGANWFLGILFGVCILNKIQNFFFYKSKIVFILQAIILYIVGYQFAKAGMRLHIGIVYLDLVLIGQIFYNIGYLLKQDRIFNVVENSKIIWFILFAVSTVCIWIIEKYLHIAVDWPSRTFNNPILDGWCAINGISFVFAVSLFIEHKLHIVKKIFGYLGKKTIGILLLHFSFFKVQYIIFFAIGVISKEDISCLTPGMMSNDILATRYWAVISSCSILLCLIVWNILMKVRLSRFLLGNDKQAYSRIWNVFVDCKPYKLLLKNYERVINKLKKNWLVICHEFRSHRMLCTSILLLVLLVSIPWLSRQLCVIAAKMYTGGDIIECAGNGFVWKNGKYDDDWIGNNSELVINNSSNENKKVKITYYTIKEMNNVNLHILCDNIEIGICSLNEGFGEIVFDAKPGKWIYRLEADKSYNPAKEGASDDLRDLVFIINSIEIM